ncbi:hypothetical protein PLESTM_000922600 [Pleodorina starrii]|nr:hypothetical protein PLESTM_000922600 [Pleodorina starrii]
MSSGTASATWPADPSPTAAVAAATSGPPPSLGLQQGRNSDGTHHRTNSSSSPSNKLLPGRHQRPSRWSLAPCRRILLSPNFHRHRCGGRPLLARGDQPAGRSVTRVPGPST